MNYTPETFADLFRQGAFISALIAGFSLAFLAVLLTNVPDRRVATWTAAFSIAATAGLTVCSLGWTLAAPRMAAAVVPPGAAFEMPAVLLNIHRLLSKTFLVCFYLFLTSLALSGWIRSRTLGAVSTAVSVLAMAGAGWVLHFFVR
jgi:hypothetical protein